MSVYSPVPLPSCQRVNRGWNLNGTFVSVSSLNGSINKGIKRNADVPLDPLNGSSKQVNASTLKYKKVKLSP
jgi:hypothetical protein